MTGMVLPANLPEGWRIVPIGEDGRPLVGRATVLEVARKRPSEAVVQGWAALPSRVAWGVVTGPGSACWVGPEDGAAWAVTGPDGVLRHLHAGRQRPDACTDKALHVVPIGSVVALAGPPQPVIVVEPGPAWDPVRWPGSPTEVDPALAGPAFADIAGRWSELTGVSPTVALVAALGSYSTALAGRVSIHPGGAWWEHNPSLYVMDIMSSGFRKSPLLDLAMAPWWPQQEAAIERWRERMDEVEDADDDDERPRKGRPKAPAKPPPPPTLLVSDFTPESLLMALTLTPAIMLNSAEADEIFGALVRGEKVQVGPLLKSYSGERAPGVTRITRASHVATGARIRAGLVGLGQPGILYGAGQRREFLEQGLLGRLLWGISLTEMTPDLERLDRRLVGAEDVAARRWADMMARPFGLPQVDRSSEGVDDGDPVAWHMCPRGERALLEYADWCKKRGNPGGDLYDLQTWLLKAHGQAARIAATLACVAGDVQGNVISLACVRQAIELVQAFEAHTKAAWVLAGWPPGTDEARHLWLRCRPMRDAGGATPIHAVEDALVPGPVWSPPQIDAALEILAGRGFVKLRRRGKGRPEAVEWNPRAEV